MQATIKKSKTIEKILNEKIKPYLQFNKSGIVQVYKKDYDKIYGAIVKTDRMTDKNKIKTTYGDSIEINNPFKVVIELYRGRVC